MSMENVPSSSQSAAPEMPPSQPAPASPEHTPSSGGPNRLVGILVALILVTASACAGYWLHSVADDRQQTAVVLNQLAQPKTNAGDELPSEEIAAQEESATSTPNDEELVVVTSSSDSEYTFNWIVPKELPDQKFFTKIEPSWCEPLEVIQYFRVGQAITKGNGARSDIIIARISPCGLGYSEDIMRFLKPLDGSPTLWLAKHSGDITNYVGKFAFHFQADTWTTITAFASPEKLVGPKQGQLLDRVSAPYGVGLFADVIPNEADVRVAFIDPHFGKVYMAGVDAANNPNLSGFVLQTPDGIAHRYEITVPFVNGKGVPSVLWNDGTKNTEAYVYFARSCGPTPYVNLGSDIDRTVDLTPIGKVAGSGVTVYGLRDPNHAAYITAYDGFMVIEGQTKPSREAFVKNRPLFFWLDAFGRLVRFEREEFMPQAECGKPVIYLYPEKTTDVSVHVAPTGGFTVTEPAYGTGWKVTAEPSGRLTDHQDGKVWPYLFWEGRGTSTQTQPNDRGFVVAQDTIPDFLEKTLAKIGLNAQERKDFIEFWAPRMNTAPYYFVTFYGNDLMDEIAPLSVTPRPDTIIRILMDYRPLQKPITVAPLTIRTPKRAGFTVVEWGGVLHK